MRTHIHPLFCCNGTCHICIFTFKLGKQQYVNFNVYPPIFTTHGKTRDCSWFYFLKDSVSASENGRGTSSFCSESSRQLRQQFNIEEEFGQQGNEVPKYTRNGRRTARDRNSSPRQLYWSQPEANLQEPSLPVRKNATCDRVAQNHGPSRVFSACLRWREMPAGPASLIWREEHSPPQTGWTGRLDRQSWLLDAYLYDSASFFHAGIELTMVS